MTEQTIGVPLVEAQEDLVRELQVRTLECLEMLGEGDREADEERLGDALAALRALRELSLDDAVPDDLRPPRLR